MVKKLVWPPKKRYVQRCWGGALYNLCLFKVSFNALPAKIVIEDLYINQFSDKIMPSASHL